MNFLASELKIKLFPPEGDFVGLWISVSNGQFAGGCKAYASFKGLVDFVTQLKGFPKKLNQRESWMNAPITNEAGGFASLDFYCYDHSGHTALRAKLRVDTPTDCRIEEADYVELEMKFEPSAMDSFVSQLQNALRDNEGIAVLAR